MVRDLTPQVSAFLTVLEEKPLPPQLVSVLSDSEGSLTIEGAAVIPLGSPVKVVQDEPRTGRQAKHKPKVEEIIESGE